MRPTPGSFVVLLTAALPLGTIRAQQETIVPAGTSVPIRFLGSIVSGRERPGDLVVVQTMGALVVGGCVVVPPFRHVLGRVTVSQGPRRGGGSGALEIRFDTLIVDHTHHLALDAVLDSLEYALPQNVLDSGLVVASLHRRTLPLALTALAAPGEVLAVPVALVSGLELLRRGPKVRIVPGELGRLRFVSRTVVHGFCTPLASYPELSELPGLPRFVAQVADRKGTRTGDPIDLIFLGSGADIHAAFVRAGWQTAGAPTVGSLAREVTALVFGRNAYEAPVSTEYFQGRRQDLAYQLQGPDVRIRHHLRIWRVDSTAGVWVGAAIRDNGVFIRPLRGTATHRVDPDADAERDFVVSALGAAGCAELVDYVVLPGAVRSGQNLSRQPFFTDGRAAVVRLRRCDGPGPH
jgi:hypothetical protein